MSSIVLYLVLYELKMYNHKIKTSSFSPCLWHPGVYPQKAVYDTMQEINILNMKYETLN